MDFFPKNPKFFDLFEELAGKAETAGKILSNIKVSHNNIISLAKKTRELENEADETGLAGASYAVGGINVLLWDGWMKVLIGLVFSTFIGFGLAHILLLSIAWIFQKRLSVRSEGNLGNCKYFLLPSWHLAMEVMTDRNL